MMATRGVYPLGSDMCGEMWSMRKCRCYFTTNGGAFLKAKKRKRLIELTKTAQSPDRMHLNERSLNSE